MKVISPFRFGIHYQKMKNKTERWENYSKESKELHKKFYALSEEFHNLLKSPPYASERVNTLINKITSIEKEIDSLKDKHYESFNNSLHRPRQSNL